MPAATGILSEPDVVTALEVVTTESAPPVKGYRPTLSMDGTHFLVGGGIKVTPQQYNAFCWWVENHQLQPLLRSLKNQSGRDQKQFIETCQLETGVRWNQILSWRRLEWWKALYSEMLGAQGDSYRLKLANLTGKGGDALEKVFDSDDSRSHSAIVAGNKLLMDMGDDPVIKKPQSVQIGTQTINNNQQTQINLTVEQVKQWSPQEIADWFFNKRIPVQPLDVR